MKIKGIKKTVGTYNNWIGHAEIMLNKETNEVYTNVYTSASEFRPNEPDTRIMRKGNVSMTENWDKTTMEEVKSIIEHIENGEVWF